MPNPLEPLRAPLGARPRDVWSRRRLLGGMLVGAAALGAGVLTPGAAQAKSAAEINAGVTAARERLFRTRPGSQELYNRASGVLIIPEVVKAGFVLGGAYGEGALLVGGRTDSYWSYAAASIGFQAGGQRTSQALFFMTPTALSQFLRSDGFEVGADAEVTVIEDGAELAVDTNQDMHPIIAIVYGREGLLGGASLQGGKYSRITP